MIIIHSFHDINLALLVQEWFVKANVGKIALPDTPEFYHFIISHSRFIIHHSPRHLSFIISLFLTHVLPFNTSTEFYHDAHHFSQS